jgi:hypothetical protein
MIDLLNIRCLKGKIVCSMDPESSLVIILCNPILIDLLYKCNCDENFIMQYDIELCGRFGYRSDKICDAYFLKHNSPMNDSY